MNKYLVTIEFRFSVTPKHDDDFTSKTKKITIGVYDDLKSACDNGNKNLKVLESKFELNPNYNNKEQRFSANGGCFNIPITLVTHLGYLLTPFEFYAKITTLNFESTENAINEVVDAIND